MIVEVEVTRLEVTAMMCGDCRRLTVSGVHARGVGDGPISGMQPLKFLPGTPQGFCPDHVAVHRTIAARRPSSTVCYAGRWVECWSQPMSIANPRQ